MSRPASARFFTQLSLPTASRRTSSSRSVAMTLAGRSHDGSCAWKARMTLMRFMCGGTRSRDGASTPSEQSADGAKAPSLRHH